MGGVLAVWETWQRVISSQFSVISRRGDAIRENGVPRTAASRKWLLLVCLIRS